MNTWLPLSRLLADRRGNFGIMTAILLPVTLGVGGIAIDLTKAVQIKSEMQAIADSGALAAASSMAYKNYTKAQGIALAEQFMASQMVNYLKTGDETDAQTDQKMQATKDATDTSVKETVNGTKGKIFEVTVSTSYKMPLNPLTQLIGMTDITLGASSTAQSATETTTGISMYLALDRSGSMSFKTDTVNTVQNSCVNWTESNWGGNIRKTRPCYVRKIEALQTAAGALFTSLSNADKKGTLVRVGGVSYTDSAQAQSPIAWGTTTIAKYVDDLPYEPTGGTDANGAMTLAYNALKSDNTTEKTEQEKKGNGSFNRFIVLMTDGKMTGASASFNYGLDQSVRAKCNAAKADGIQIFTVAFMAPSEGKSLLEYCASSKDYYYEPDDMTNLVAAFGEIAEKATKAATRLTN